MSCRAVNLPGRYKQLFAKYKLSRAYDANQHNFLDAWNELDDEDQGILNDIKQEYVTTVPQLQQCLDHYFVFGLRAFLHSPDLEGCCKPATCATCVKQHYTLLDMITLLNAHCVPSSGMPHINIEFGWMQDVNPGDRFCGYLTAFQILHKTFTLYRRAVIDKEKLTSKSTIINLSSNGQTGRFITKLEWLWMMSEFQKKYINMPKKMQTTLHTTILNAEVFARSIMSDITEKTTPYQSATEIQYTLQETVGTEKSNTLQDTIGTAILMNTNEDFALFSYQQPEVTKNDMYEEPSVIRTFLTPLVTLERIPDSLTQVLLAWVSTEKSVLSSHDNNKLQYCILFQLNATSLVDLKICTAYERQAFCTQPCQLPFSIANFRELLGFSIQREYLAQCTERFFYIPMTKNDELQNCMKEGRMTREQAQKVRILYVGKV